MINVALLGILEEADIAVLTLLEGLAKDEFFAFTC